MRRVYCTSDDVARKNQLRAYSTGTAFNINDVNEYIARIANEINLTCKANGYDIDSFADYSTTTTTALSAGSSVSATLTSASGFQAASSCMIWGVVSNVEVFEIITVESVSGNVVTFSSVTNSFDSGATIEIVNDALGFLRDLNATGAAWRSEDSVLMGQSPNFSEHAEMLRDLYLGTEENQSGLWAIRNLPNYLHNEVDTDERLDHRPNFAGYAIDNATALQNEKDDLNKVY